ncbi:MAG: hypothetical protein M0038_19760 [Pseudomonadota bacterium]|jgi:hypothetical protein|nr:hypothetical protein [Pseudomonadota bacterium]
MKSKSTIDGKTAAGEFDADALFQRKSTKQTQARYLEKLGRERAYLESEIEKLTGKGARQSAIRTELREALRESSGANDAILRGDWFEALQIRDQMHIRLHQTKQFQWAPDLQRGVKFKRAKGSRNTKALAVEEHVEVLVRSNPDGTHEELYQRADRRIIGPMPRDTFKRYVTATRRKLGVESRAGRPRK